MFCIKCGKQLPEGAAFCYACGSRAWTEEGAVPSAAEASDIQNPAFSLPADACVKPGNLFVVGDSIYFLVHADANYRSHAQLWKSDKMGKNCVCLLDFEKQGYSMPLGVAFQSDRFYFMAMVGSLILFEGYDAKTYYYDIAKNTHGVLTCSECPGRVSMDGKYFYKTEGNFITIRTPQEALTGEEGRKIPLGTGSLPALYEQLGTMWVLENAEHYIYDDHQLLAQLKSGDSYRWVRIDLFDPSDFAILSAEYDLPRGDFGRGLCLSGNKVVFRYLNHVVIVDTDQMQHIKEIRGMGDAEVALYGEKLYLAAPGGFNDYLYDFGTNEYESLRGRRKLLYRGFSEDDIFCTPEGAYLRCGAAEIYFLPAAELFAPIEGEYHGQPVPPILSLTYDEDAGEYVATEK